jgi:hypothetical protein
LPTAATSRERLLDLARVDVAESQVADLALGLHREEGVERFHEGDAGGGHVAQVHDVEALETQGAQVLFGAFSQLFGAERGRPPLVRQSLAAELRGDHQIARVRVEHLGDQLICDEGAVVPGRVDEVDAELHRAAQDGARAPDLRARPRCLDRPRIRDGFDAARGSLKTVISAELAVSALPPTMDRAVTQQRARVVAAGRDLEKPARRACPAGAGRTARCVTGACGRPTRSAARCAAHREQSNEPISMHVHASYNLVGDGHPQIGSVSICSKKFTRRREGEKIIDLFFLSSRLPVQIDTLPDLT